MSQSLSLSLSANQANQLLQIKLDWTRLDSTLDLIEWNLFIYFEMEVAIKICMKCTQAEYMEQWKRGSIRLRTMLHKQRGTRINCIFVCTSSMCWVFIAEKIEISRDFIVFFFIKITLRVNNGFPGWYRSQSGVDSTYDWSSLMFDFWWRTFSVEIF